MSEEKEDQASVVNLIEHQDTEDVSKASPNITEEANRQCIRCKSTSSNDTFSLYCDKCYKYLKLQKEIDFNSDVENSLTECNICFNSYTKKKRLPLHNCARDGVYNCSDCGRQVGSRISMIEHVQLIHRKRYGQVYKCRCGRNFSTSVEFQKHKRAGKKSGVITVRVNSDVNFFKCEICEKVLTTAIGLRLHLLAHNGVKPFKCTSCDKSFTHQSSMINHLRTHSNVKSYKCTLCPKSFAHPPSLTTHMRSHSGLRPFECSICQKGFTQNSNLITHMRSHVGDKPYRCDLCDKTFTHRGTLTNHMRVHSGEKPFSCQVCQRSFAQQANLITHIRTHSGERPYKCYVCERSFAVQSNLRVHLKSRYCALQREKLLSVAQDTEDTIKEAEPRRNKILGEAELDIS